MQESYVHELNRKLSSLQESLEKFEWPQTMARNGMVHLSSGLQNKVQAQVLKEPHPFYQYLSRGFPGTRTTSIPSGEYAVKLELGRNSEEMQINIREGMNYDQVLGAVQDAVNRSRVRAQAWVLNQRYPGQKIPGLGSLGSILAISLDPRFKEQTLTVEDVDGDLLQRLGMQPWDPAFEVPGSKSKMVRSDSIARPSRYSSQAFRPGEDIDWDIEHHVFQINTGLDAEHISIRVVDRSTWEEARDLAGEDHALVKDTQDWEEMVENLTLEPDQIEDDTTWSQVVSWVQTETVVTHPDTDYQDLLRSVDSHLSRVLDIQSQVVQNKITDYSLSRPVQVDGLRLDIELTNPKVGQRMALTDVQGSALDRLGLNRTAQPGSDGRVQIDSREFVSGGNLFTTARGDLEMELKDTTQRSLPLRTGDSVLGVINRTEEILNRAGELLRFLEKSKNMWKDDLPGMWRDSIQKRLPSLRDIGITPDTDSRGLSLDTEKFSSALRREPSRVHGILMGEQEGLLSEWMENISRNLAAGAKSYLRPHSALEGIWDPSREQTNLELEQRRNLLDFFS